MCGLGLSLGVFLVIIYAIFRTPSNAGNEERGLKSAMMGLHEQYPWMKEKKSSRKNQMSGRSSHLTTVMKKGQEQDVPVHVMSLYT